MTRRPPTFTIGRLILETGIGSRIARTHVFTGFDGTSGRDGTRGGGPGRGGPIPRPSPATA